MPDYLPLDTDYLKNPALMAVIAALNDGGDGARIVGGAVRDALLGVLVADIDIATKLRPDIVIARLKSEGISAIPTGLDHGTITAVVDKQNFEITTLRRDVATDGRRATIAFATEWQDDAARRDFTINALYADPKTGEIFDYFGGKDDLEARTIRFIGDAAQRIAEDHLRILRYFRFLARFGRTEDVDPTALIACKAAANSLMALSRERIAQELTRLLVLPDPRFAIQLMIENGIFAPFLPELSPQAAQHFAQLVERQNEYDIRASLSARLLAILPDDAIIADKVAMRLKLSNRLRVELADRCKFQAPDSSNIRAIAYHIGIGAAQDSALLRCSDKALKPCLEQLEGWQVPVFPMRGGDLIARGLSAGPVIAKTLQAIEAAWIEAGFPLNAQLDAIANQLIAGALSANK
jgi:poly(A) polymerase